MNRVINAERTIRDIIVIGASSGGIEAVMALLAGLPADLPAAVGVVIHRSAMYESDWSATLGSHASIRVLQPEHRVPLERGTVYVAPPDRHMSFSLDHVELDDGPKLRHSRPSVDTLFSSAARVFGPRVVAVVLTGNGQDGSVGMIDVFEHGGIGLVQARDEALRASMPTQAVALDHVQGEFGIEELGAVLTNLAYGRAVE